ncbi:MAG: DUF305 domain-containing protein [Patulibacter sp.]
MSYRVSRITFSVLALAVLGGVAACGDDQTAGNATAPTATAASSAGTSASSGSGSSGDRDGAPEASGAPSAPQSAEEAAKRAKEAARRAPVDAAYVRQMMPHDAVVAVLAGRAAKEATSAEVKALARDVQQQQSQELRALQEIAAKRGYGLAGADTEQRKDAKTLGLTVAQLGTPINATKVTGDFDQAFVALLITHHKGSLRMNRAERKHGTDKELRALAQARSKALTRELRELRKLKIS